MNNKILILAVAIIVIAGGIYFFAREKDNVRNSIKEAEENMVVEAENPTTPNAPVVPEITNETAPETAILTPEIKEFNITARRFVFEPDNIRVKKGDAVKLNITSVDVTHGFSISEFGVNANLEPGKMTIVEFVASKSGTFTFFCSVVCGAGHPDMKGALVVE